MGDVLNRGSKAAPRWYCRFVDVDGKRKCRPTKQPTKAGALVFLAAIEARLRRGDVGIVEPTPEERERKVLTVGALADRFLGDVEGVAGYAPPRIKSIANYRHDARKNLGGRLPRGFADRAAAAVRLVDVEGLRDAMLARGLAAASVVQVLAALSKVFNWGRKVGLLDCQNPVQGIERPRPAVSLDYLDRGEVGRLLDVAEKQATAEGATYPARVLWPMVAVAIFAGLRKGELFGLRWIDLALGAGRLDVNRSYTLTP
ncbi:MAG: hypothetical protein EXR72_03800 [Myxococcales bacterium]|nr:hypothetical protein [Myxococcales bacterium]